MKSVLYFMTDLSITTYKIKNAPNYTNPVSQYCLETQNSYLAERHS